MDKWPIEALRPGKGLLRDFCCKSDAAFGCCGFFVGAPPKRAIPGSVRDLLVVVLASMVKPY